MRLDALPPPPVAAPRPQRTRTRRRSVAFAPLTARGEPMIWLTGGALITCLLMILGLLTLIGYSGAGTFWPTPVSLLRTFDGQVYMGEVTNEDEFRPRADALDGVADPVNAAQARQRLDARGGRTRRRLFRTGNYELTGTHFEWVSDFLIAGETRPEWALVIERQAWGRFYGIPTGFEMDGQPAATTASGAWELYGQYHDEIRARWRQCRQLETDDIGRVNKQLEAARLAVRAAELRHGQDSPQWQTASGRFVEIESRARDEFERITERITGLRTENARYRLLLETADGRATALPLADIVRAYPANQLSGTQKVGLYLSRWWEFLSDVPREANSEGGVFPALCGTVLMTLLMSLAVVPIGVLAALYLREYARAGPIISAVRIAINNLAGVPSIVFGVFGLGFFCYGIGSFIDAGSSTPWPPRVWFTAFGVLVAVAVVATALGLSVGFGPRARSGPRRLLSRLAIVLWLIGTVLAVLLVTKTPFFDGFYRAQLPNPTFGKGALLWASLTLALLTVPVVIVATEEALAAVPSSMREGSYACGGSKWQTIRRIVMPRALPGIMTGAILAMARGAGEVAPLMLVGAVKLAPELPIDTSAPFGVNRSFMHLGFHIYDLGFQSQNSAAAKPMVYTTTLLLIVVIATLNVTAVWLRSRLRRRFVTGQF